MNVLIADDDRFVVSALEQKINWSSLGIEHIHIAYNIRQAMKLFAEHAIDILISDIEMPQGSGLELLAWIRSEGYNVQTIFLTNFADFHYAQKAIELQSFEYYLKPIEFDKLELIIRKAVKKVKASQQNEEAMKVGQYWQQNKEELKDHFWTTFVKSSEHAFSVEELQKQVNSKMIHYKMDDCFVPLLLELHPYQLVDYKEILSVFNNETNLDNRLKELIKEAFQNEGIRLEGLLPLGTNNEEFLAFFKLVDQIDENTSSNWVIACNRLINQVNKYLNCDVICSIGTAAPLKELKTVTTRLQFDSKETITFRNVTVSPKDYHKADSQYVEPNLPLLEHYLQSENRASFINKCQQYLTNLVDKNEATLTIISSFKIDITQLIYTHLKKREILAHQLFQGKIFDFLQEQSTRSIEDLMNYLSYLIDVSLDYLEFINSQKSVVQTICDYIDQHYQENITRSSLANILYLSPDYIARIFKKETGISLINYLIKKRVDVAKQLLTNTDLPVHLISDKVGYGNYSYFTKIFKKETNYTPVDYRKKIK